MQSPTFNGVKGKVGPASKVKAWLAGVLTERLIQIAVLVSLVVGVTAAVQHRALANCLAAYNDRSAKAAAARNLSAEADRVALDNLFFAIDDAQRLPPDVAKARLQDAFNAYVASRRTSDKNRRENPLPSPPAEVCR